jgi:hypothetical protein
MVKRGRKSQRGGEFSGRPMAGGNGVLAPLMPAVYNPEGAPMVPSQYYTQAAGGRRRKSRGRKSRGRKSRRSRKSKKGGEGVLATAAVPFGILALQRYFKGSKTSKQGVKNMGRSFKRTFRRRL